MVPSKIRLTTHVLGFGPGGPGRLRQSFPNGFHFDDFHTVTENPFIRDLRNAPRFFTDPTMFSTLGGSRRVASHYVALPGDRLPPGRWVDRPFYFQLSTFVWFLVQLVFDAASLSPHHGPVRLAGFEHMDRHSPQSRSTDSIPPMPRRLTTSFSVATCSARWDRSSFAVVHAAPRQRKFGLYLIPAVVSYFAKAPALIFPLILLATSIYSRQTTPAPAHPLAPSRPRDSTFGVGHRRIRDLDASVFFFFFLSIPKS